MIVWGNRAEALNKILHKGRSVCVEGRLQTRQWEDREGHRRSTARVVADRVVVLGPPAHAGGPQGAPGGGHVARADRDAAGDTGHPGDTDDLPF